jgi:DNA-binding HxlR family transcriptional regulator
LEYLDDHPEGSNFAELQKQVAPDDKHLDRSLSKLKKDDLIEQPEVRGPYFLTEKGREVLGK